jgi:hypothetical protein
MLHGLVTDGTVQILTCPENDGRAEAGVKDARYRINAFHPSAAWRIQNVEAARVDFCKSRKRSRSSTRTRRRPCGIVRVGPSAWRTSSSRGD